MRTVFAVVKPFSGHDIGMHLSEDEFGRLDAEHHANCVRITVVDDPPDNDAEGDG